MLDLRKMRRRVLIALAVVGGMTLVAGEGAAADRLLEAVKNQDRDTAFALLKEHVDVNVPQADGATALHWAVHWNDEPLVEALVHAGASVDAANDLGVTPLALACGNGDAKIVALLLGAGADPDAVAAGEPVLMTAARTGSAGIVSALVTAGADVNATDGARGQTALMWAVSHGHSDVVAILLAHGADVHARSGVGSVVVQRGNRYGGVVSQERAVSERTVVTAPQGGSTPLLFAARSGDLASARLLVEAGANVNDTAPDGTGALAIASHSGHTSVASFLVDHGADVNAAGSGYTALHAAVLRGDLPLATHLVTAGADVNARITAGTPSRRYSKDFAFNEAWVGATAFWLAARFGELDILRLLAHHDAARDVASRDETTPLIAVVAAGVDSGSAASDSRERRLDPEELAARAVVRDEHERRLLQVVELLVELGADVNAVNFAGDTALHRAAGRGYNTVIRYLVDKGARLDMRNRRAQTPLGVAISRTRATEEYAPALEGTVDLIRSLGGPE